MASPVAAITADPGASPAPAAPASPVGAGSPPASPAGTSSDGGSLPSAAESQNIRQLREAYDNLKKEYEPYQKLGKPDDISGNVSIATKITQAAVEAGTALGYQEQEIREALVNDPDGTLAFLRQKQAESAQNQDPTQKLQQLLDKRLKPLEDTFAKEKEAKISSEANTRFNTAFDEGMKSLFKDETLPTEEQDVLYEGALLLLRRDPEAVKALREGKQSDVAKYLTEAKSMLDKYYLGRTQRESKRIPAAGQSAKPNAQTEKLSLSDIANGNFPKTGPLAKYS
jgi:hypothetical protein